jgi:hypothetical protein
VGVRTGPVLYNAMPATVTALAMAVNVQPLQQRDRQKKAAEDWPAAGRGRDHTS